MKRYLKFIATFLLMLTLSACGLKGSLYFPDEEKFTAVPAPFCLMLVG